MNELIWLGSGWVLYFTLHSFLASQRVKNLLNPGGSRFYRLGYNVLSSIGLMALLFYGASIPSEKFFDNTGLVRYASLMLSTFGVMTIQLAFRQYRFGEFIGFKNESAAELQVTGVLSKVRHPIYSGIILITLGYFLFVPTWPSVVAAVSILLYLPIGIYLEEKKLTGIYGEAYVTYRKRVPPLIPRLGKFGD